MAVYCCLWSVPLDTQPRLGPAASIQRRPLQSAYRVLCGGGTNVGPIGVPGPPIIGMPPGLGIGSTGGGLGASTGGGFGASTRGGSGTTGSPTLGISGTPPSLGLI